jgi:hypothetical protein
VQTTGKAGKPFPLLSCFRPEVKPPVSENQPGEPQIVTVER